MRKKVLPTIYRILGDGIVCAEAWDETIEEIVSNPSNGGKNDKLKRVDKKIEMAPIFFSLLTDLSYEHPENCYVCTPLRYRPHMSLLGEQNRRGPHLLCNPRLLCAYLITKYCLRNALIFS